MKHQASEVPLRNIQSVARYYESTVDIVRNYSEQKFKARRWKNVCWLTEGLVGGVLIQQAVTGSQGGFGIAAGVFLVALAIGTSRAPDGVRLRRRMMSSH